MPLTYASMLLCTAAISGVPFLSGFYSKDAILGFAADTWSQGAGPAAYLPLVLLALAAPLTALYMFRMFLLTFSGEARSEHAAHAKEVPLPMSVPLILLGLGAALGSFLWIAQPHPTESGHSTATLLASGSLVLGLGAALLFFQFKKASPSRAAASFGPFARAARGLYGVDGFFQAAVVVPTRIAGRLCASFDRRIIDGAVHGIGSLAIRAGEQVRRVQNGRIQAYIYLTYAGLLALTLFAVWRVS